MDWLSKLEAVAAILWSFDQFLKVFGKLTPWKWDDNLADILGNWLAKYFPPKEGG